MKEKYEDQCSEPKHPMEIAEREWARETQKQMRLQRPDRSAVTGPGDVAIELPPVAGITDLINESISALRELNGRLSNTADHLVGSRPECNSAKEPEEGCLRERTQTLRRLIDTAHAELGRLQSAL